MMIRELIAANRTCRRFDASVSVTPDDLRELVELARLSSSSGNQQKLRFLLNTDAERNDAIFESLLWAAYLEDWPGPPPNERPTAYILMLHDSRTGGPSLVDAGIAAQSMLLGARERGLAGCLFGGIRRDGLRNAIPIPHHWTVVLTLAIGKPIGIVQVDPLPPEGDIRYWRDEQGTHHVPKRSLEDLIVTFDEL